MERSRYTRGVSPRPVRLALFLALCAAGVIGQAARLDFEAGRLLLGAFRYRTSLGGQAVGESQIQIRKVAGSSNFAFSNLVAGAFSQSWEAITSRAFAPISARLRTGQGSSAHSVFELTYLGNRVTGFAFSGKGQPSPTRRNVDETVAADTVDQRIDWAAVMARKDYDADGRFTFHVYDPSAGNSRVLAEVRGLETTTVPAGSFKTVRVVYRIEKNRGTEIYEVLIQKESPRALVKELFPNGAVTELLEMKP
jgi:hypothetical protein